MPSSSMTAGFFPAISSATKMPCWKPRWASWSPGTMSPTAYTLGTLVRSRSSVRTKPRSIFTPCCSYPRSAVVGPRPTATSNSSASMVSPPWMVSRMPASVRSTFSYGLPVLNAIPRLRNARSSILELCSSSGGSSRGSASTIVTSTPNDFHALANSQPITPPPRTTADAGTWSRVSACSEVMTRPPSLALDQRHLVGLHEALKPLVEPGDNAVLVRVDGLHVDAVERGLYAELPALARRVGDLAGVQQRLGRDAATVQAGAADLVLLDQRDRQPELGGPERGRVPAAATTQDDHVIVVLSCAHFVIVTRYPAAQRFGVPFAVSRRGGGRVGLFSRREKPGTVRSASRADLEHLEQFVQTRYGVEGFVEPRTTVTETTM